MKHGESRLHGSFHRFWMPLIVSTCFAGLVFGCLWSFGLNSFSHIDVQTATGVAQKLLCSGGIALLLSVLVFIVSREALREPQDKTAERPVWYFPLMSGLLSLAAMCVAYSFLGMWPFGERTGMVVDMHHQYAPLMSGLRDAILGGDLSLYNFEVGLGANYLSLAAYYLASPLNLLLLLFPETLLAEGILFITLIKNALCGAMFALCVQAYHKKQELYIPVVSIMYSLMMYLLAYSWNIMWLDVVMVLPLVVFGFERMMRTGKFLTYVLSLAYAMFANYYIGFMLCIFLVLYFIFSYSLNKPRGWPLGFGRFAGYSLLAAGLVAFLLIPVYFALKTTSAAGAGLPEPGSTMDIFKLIGRHLAGTSPTIRSGNLPNVYCGVLTAICVPLFALNKRIDLRRRLTGVALWLVLAFSFFINWSDLLWHGLHAPNDLPYRFSFLYSFWLLMMAAWTLRELKGIGFKQVLAVFAGALGYLILEERFGDDVYGFEIIYVNIALVAVYTVILALVASKKLRRRMAYALLLLAVTVEMTVNAGYAIVQVNANEYFTRHEDYVDNAVSEVLRVSVKEAQKLGDEKYGEGNYRIEFFPRRTCVDTALFHYQGITNFASSNYYTTTKLLGGWGYAVNGVNSHLYQNFMPFTDSLLGVRYVISNQELSDNPQLTKLKKVNNSDQTYYIYENSDALSLGYVVDSSIKDYQFTKYDPISSMEDLFGKLNDTYLPLFTTNPIAAEFDTGAEMGFTSAGFRVQPDESGVAAVFTSTIQTAGQVYVYADCMAAKSMTIRYGDKTVNASPHEPYLISLGTCELGEIVSLDVVADQYCSGNFYVVTLNENAYNTGIQILKNEQWNVTQKSDSYLSGTVNASFNGTMMTSIPYDAGWTVRVDGKKVETCAIDGGLLAFDVTAGEHTVSLSYRPRGLLIGMLISVVSLILLVTWGIIDGLLRKKAGRLEAERSREAEVQPVQGEFVTEQSPMTEIPPLPETFEELTSELSAEEQPPVSEE